MPGSLIGASPFRPSTGFALKGARALPRLAANTSGWGAVQNDTWDTGNSAVKALEAQLGVTFDIVHWYGNIPNGGTNHVTYHIDQLDPAWQSARDRLICFHTMSFKHDTSSTVGNFTDMASSTTIGSGYDQIIQDWCTWWLAKMALGKPLQANVSIGGTSLTLTSTAGYNVGTSNVKIGTGAGAETVSVTAIPDATHLTVSALTKTHSSGDAVAKLDWKLILSFQHEPSTQSGPYIPAGIQVGGTPGPSTYRSAWVGFRTAILRYLPTANVAFCYVNTVGGTTNGNSNQYYPGDDVIDWLGFDGYNNPGTGTAPSRGYEKYDPAVQWARAATGANSKAANGVATHVSSTTMPILFHEFGTSDFTFSGSNDPHNKQEWFADLDPYSRGVQAYIPNQSTTATTRDTLGSDHNGNQYGKEIQAWVYFNSSAGGGWWMDGADGSNTASLAAVTQWWSQDHFNNTGATSTTADPTLQVNVTVSGYTVTVDYTGSVPGSSGDWHTYWGDGSSPGLTTGTATPPTNHTHTFPSTAATFSLTLRFDRTSDAKFVKQNQTVAVPATTAANTYGNPDQVYLGRYSVDRVTGALSLIKIISRADITTKTQVRAVIPAIGEYLIPSGIININTGAILTSGANDNVMTLDPIDVSQVMSFDTVAAWIATAATGGTPKFRIGLYADDGTASRPSGAPLVDWGQTGVLTATGAVSPTVTAFTLNPGRYWIGCAFQPAGTITVYPTPVIASSAPGVPITAPISTGLSRGWSQTGVTGALPTIGTLAPYGSPVIVQLRRSA